MILYLSVGGGAAFCDAAPVGGASVIFNFARLDFASARSGSILQRALGLAGISPIRAGDGRCLPPPRFCCGGRHQTPPEISGMGFVLPCRLRTPYRPPRSAAVPSASSIGRISAAMIAFVAGWIPAMQVERHDKRHQSIRFPSHVLEVRCRCPGQVQARCRLRPSIMLPP